MLFISLGVMSFLSGTLSNAGNTIQERLFRQWGGAPSITLLRFSDNTLDRFTKERYRRWFEDNIRGLSLPSSEEEKCDPDIADEIYQSAGNFLREYTRDKKRFPIIYNDNVAYGFSRNLLALRSAGIALAILSLLLNIFMFFLLNQAETFSFSPDYRNQLIMGVAAITLSLISLAIFAFHINGRYVRGRAVRYARSLLSAIEGQR